MKILLIRSGGLGDCILTLPIAQHIRHIYPGAELHVLGNETMLAVARFSGEFEGFNSIDERGFSGLYSESKPSDFLRLFFSRFDVVYCYSAGNKELLSRNILNSGAGMCHLLDPRPPRNHCSHILEHLMTIFNGNNKEISDNTEIYNLNKTRRELSVLSKKNGKKLVMHPGSGSISKNWPIDRYLSVAERMRMHVTFLLGPAEIERSPVKNIPESNYAIICPENIGKLSSMLAEASLYIGNDSGVSHLASFCGTPSIVLFGPTDPTIWRPLGSNVTVISSPDGNINGISADEIVAKVREVVNA